MMFLQVIILLAGFLFLVKGADWFVEGAASIAKKQWEPACRRQQSVLLLQ